MRVVYYTLPALIGCFSTILSISQEHNFWSTATQSVTEAQDPSDCNDVQYGPLDDLYPDLGSEFVYTFVNDQTDVYFFPQASEVTDSSLWQIERLTGPNLPDNTLYVGPTCTHNFRKISGDQTELFELYRVKLMADGNAAIDSLDVHVFPSQKGGNQLFSLEFDEPSSSGSSGYEDGYGHVKATSYPTFSGNGNSRSDTGSLKEGVGDRCAYTAYFSDENIDPGHSPRRGTGQLHSWLPSSDLIELADPKAGYKECSSTSYFNYDFCSDPCGLEPFSIPYEDYAHPNLSRSAKTELNLYPNQLQGEKAYYAVSIKIPESFDESELVTTEGLYGQDHWHVIASFHQSVWPFRQSVLKSSCNATMQILYLGDSKIAIQYGLRDLNRVAFGPFDLNEGEWNDLIIGISWEQYGNSSPIYESEGSLEFWLNSAGEYIKQCLVPASDYYTIHEDFGTNSANQQPFSPADKYRQAIGPNLENVNPPYFSLNQMRGNAKNGTSGFPYEAHVYYDELRIGSSLDEVALPDVLISDDQLDCYELYLAGDGSSEYDSSDSHDDFSLGFSVFPNPVQDELMHVKMSTDNTYVEGTVIINNMMGQSVFSYDLPEEGAENLHLEIPSDFFPEGLYVVSWHHPMAILTESVVIE